MAEVGWDEVTYLKKKPQRSAEAKSSKVRLNINGGNFSQWFL